MQALQQFALALHQDLLIVKAYATGLLQQTGGLAAPDDTQLAALVSSALVMLGLPVLLLVLLPRGRKFVLDALETVLAIALIAILLAVVLGLPLGG